MNALICQTIARNFLAARDEILARIITNSVPAVSLPTGLDEHEGTTTLAYWHDNGGHGAFTKGVA